MVFKIKDKVIGNIKANRYGITRCGWKGKVVRTSMLDGEIQVRGVDEHDDGKYYNVKGDCFDLIEDKIESIW